MSNVLLRHGLRSPHRARLFSVASHPGPVNPKPNNAFRTIRNVSLAATFSVATYTLGVLYPPPLLTFISPRAAPGPPSDPNSPSALAYTTSLESQLESLPILCTHRSRPDADQWYETRPYLNYPEGKRLNSLTAGTLRGPGKLAFAPLIRSRKDDSETIAFVHVGRGLCGHDGIIHGGMLATLLDEALARPAINNLPEKVGVTANLSISYRRKAWVEGSIEDTNGQVLAEAKAMFVQPKYAKLLNTADVKQAMGEQVPSKSIPAHLSEAQSGASPRESTTEIQK